MGCLQALVNQHIWQNEKSGDQISKESSVIKTHTQIMFPKTLSKWTCTLWEHYESQTCDVHSTILGGWERLLMQPRAGSPKESWFRRRRRSIPTLVCSFVDEWYKWCSCVVEQKLTSAVSLRSCCVFLRGLSVTCLSRLCRSSWMGTSASCRRRWSSCVRRRPTSRLSSCCRKVTWL